MINFKKYSATGNDFIFIETRPDDIEKFAKYVCMRRLGVGADGVVFLGPTQDDQADYHLHIWNADGSVAEMCGNAARSSIDFMNRKTGKNKFRFTTMNGIYEGQKLDSGVIEVAMSELYDVDLIDVSDFGTQNTLYVNTGVPHVVIEARNVDDIDISLFGKRVRSDKRFKSGTNVDFFEILNHKEKEIKLRIYERGVEAETLCCGTGVVATAYACSRFFDWHGEITVHTPGGTVFVQPMDQAILFRGNVDLVYEGALNFE